LPRTEAVSRITSHSQSVAMVSPSTSVRNPRVCEKNRQEKHQHETSHLG
jgi:hypothetical protein